MTKSTVRHVVMLGDSLTDRGTMNKRSLFDGLLPLNGLAGLKGKSPVGRFTNGLTWADDIAADWTEQFIHQAPGVHTNEADKREALLQNYAFYIDDDLHVRYNGNDFVRSYAEGGLTAHDWKDDYGFMLRHGITDIKSLFTKKPSLKKDLGHAKNDIEHIATEHIVSTLRQKREKLFADDVANRYSETHKAETLVLEWTGANDLITVNDIAEGHEDLDVSIIDKVIQSRLDNVNKMIAHGYKHFMLFELPDVSLTPRYQHASPEVRARLRQNTLLFNQKLAQGLEEIKKAHPDEDYQFDVFPVFDTFNEVYEHPEQYGFEKEKLGEPYIESEDFKKSPDHTGDCHGHMFWDREHPSARMHEIIAEKLEAYIAQKYDVEPPKAHEVFDGPSIDTESCDLIRAFKCSFVHHAIKDVKEAVSFVKNHPLFKPENQPMTLGKIFYHAVVMADKFVHHIAKDLGWLNSKKQLISPVKALKAAFLPIARQQKQAELKSKLRALKEAPPSDDAKNESAMVKEEERHEPVRCRI